MKLFTVTKYGATYIVQDTYHANDVREGSNSPRLRLFTIRKIKELVRIAAQSLSQYRDKGRIALTFLTETGRTASLLISLEGTVLTIITALHNVKRQVNDVFRGVPHYYLRGHVFIKPTPKELRKDYFVKQALIDAL